VDRVLDTLSHGRWGVFLLLMAGYCAFYLVVDTFVLQQAVSWFNVRVRWGEVLPVRATAYILSLVNTQLGQGGIAVYLHRRYRIPFWQVTGTVVFVALIEIYQLALASGVGAAISREPKAPWELYGVMAGYLIGHLAYFSLPRVRRATGLPVLAAFRNARPVQYLQLLLYKTPNLLGAVVVHWLALPLFGIQIPLATLLTFLPLVFFFAALPIAAAHLGPSQAAWTYFFHDYAPGEQLLAYSLAAHFTFMLLNAVYGLCFLRRAARELSEV
jgi:hypothetical protein